MPLSVEMILARGLFMPDPPWGVGEGGGGSAVFSTVELPLPAARRPLLGSVRESPRDILGADGASTLVGKTALEPTLSGLKAL